jgi:hypothetical protein
MTIKQLGGVFGRNPTFNDVTIEGQLTFEGNIDIDSDITWEDNKKALFGNDGDLQIYHDGSHSYVSDQGTGNLRLLAENFQVKNAADTEAMIVAVPNAGVSLYYNNLAKLTTASSGVSFNGNVIMQTSGSGIDFSATAGTGTSELFDDYEEGAFVCTINGAVEPATLITSTGYYTKIGRDVFFQVSFESVDTTGYSGTLSFSGLPFVSASTFGRSITNIIQYSGATYTGSPVGEISSNSSIVNARTDVSGAPWGVMSHNAGSGRFFWITGSYKT